LTGVEEKMDVLQVQGLAKSYPHPMTRRSIPVLQQVDFTVQQGEVFGLIGPNGAGKTTTIKAIMGLITPDAGTVRLFGRSVNEASVKARIGFLPENPSFYEYLTGEEFLHYYGRLFGQDRRRRKDRVDRMLALVELERARKLPLRKYSKGMIQRMGLAQALLNDPDFLVLDEPMSGLDPLGRRLVRRIIQSLSREGKTIFFTSHILSDTELLCHRVALVVGGRLRDLGRMDPLLTEEVRGYDLVVAALAAGEVPVPGRLVSATENKLLIALDGGTDLQPYLQRLFEAGGRLLSVTPHGRSLEDRLMEELENGDRDQEGGGR
jgi:ABC-2 type transport system ATP-binding protein